MRRRYPVYKPRSLRRLEKKSTRKLIFSLILGLVILYFLFTWGLPTFIDGLSFFNKFKPASTKKASIEDSAITPPVLNIPFEATNTASIKISGYTQTKTLVQIYIDDQLKTSIESGGDGSFQTGSIELGLGTNNIYGKTIDEKGNKSLPSKTIKLIYSNEKPKLEVSEPPDNHQIKGGDKKIKVTGLTDPTSSLTINGSTVIVGIEGNFSQEVAINEGDNTIAILATSPIGNTTKLERRVTYQP